MKIDLANLPALSLGCTVFAGGGGGDPRIGELMAAEAIRAGSRRADSGSTRCICNPLELSFHPLEVLGSRRPSTPSSAGPVCLFAHSHKSLVTGAAASSSSELTLAPAGSEPRATRSVDKNFVRSVPSR